MGNNIQFFSLNQFERAAISITSESGLKEHVFDYNYYTRWTSYGSDDSIAEVIEFDLGVDQQARFRYLPILHQNSRSGKAEYFAGSEWQIFGAVWDNNEKGDLLIDHGAEVSTQKFRITLYKTITPNTEKYVGMIMPCLLLFELEFNPYNLYYDIIPAGSLAENDRGLVNFSRKDDPVRKLYMLFDHQFTGKDLDYIEDLIRSGISVLINACGDREKSFPGLRFKDIRRYVLVNKVTMRPTNGRVMSGASFSLTFRESVK